MPANPKKTGSSKAIPNEDARNAAGKQVVSERAKKDSKPKAPLSQLSLKKPESRVETGVIKTLYHEPKMISESTLFDQSEITIHDKICLKSSNEFDKRLFMLSSHIAYYDAVSSQQDDSAPSLPFNVDTYVNLLSDTWVKYDGLVDRLRRKEAAGKDKSNHVMPIFPLEIGTGVRESLRSRWRLGGDVGGSDMLLQILLFIRFSAGRVGKDGVNKAPRIALCKIRAIFLYLSEPHRNITEEDIEAVFQEIRAKRDPMVLITYGHEDALAATSKQSKSSPEDKSRIFKTKKVRYPYSKMLIPRRTMGQKMCKKHIWDIYLPVLIATKKRADTGKADVSGRSYLLIPQGYKNYGDHMRHAHLKAELILQKLRSGRPPPLWRQDMFKTWGNLMMGQFTGLLDTGTPDIFEDLRNLRMGTEKDLQTKEAKAILSQY